MNLKPCMSWSIVVLCLVSAIVGLSIMFFAVLYHEAGDNLMKTGALVTALPLLLLLAFSQGGIGVLRDEKLAPRAIHPLIWSIVVLLVMGTVLTIAWVTGLERR